MRASAQAGESSHAVEYRFLTRDGRCVWLRDHVRLLRDEDGRVERARGFMLDVTERRASEARSLEDQERFRVAFEDAPVGIAAYRLDEHDFGRFLEVNETFAQFTGHSVAQVEQMRFAELLPPAEAAADEAAIKALLATPGAAIRDQEKACAHADGSWTWLLLSTSIVRDTEGSALHALVVAKDITERKRALERIAESERELGLLLRALPTPAYVWRLVGDDYVLESFNDAAEQTTGGSIDRLVGVRARHFHSDRPDILALFDAAVATRQPQACELRYGYADGGIRDLAVSVTSVGDLVMVQTRDVSEERLQQRRLTARAAQQKILADLGRAALRGEPSRDLKRRACRELASIRGWDACGVSEFAGPDTVRVLASSTGEQVGDLLRVGPEIVSSIGDGQSLIVGDWDTDPRFARPGHMAEHRVRSSMGAPVRRDGRPAAVLTVRSRTPHAFDTEDLLFVEAVANVLSTALQARASQERLAESEMRYRTIIEAASEGVWEVGRDGRTVFANARTAQILGRELHELHERPVSDFLHPDDRESTVARLRTRDSRGAETYETRFVRGDAETVWVRISVRPMHDADGRHTGSIGMLMDVTAERLAEAEARRSRHLVTSAFEASPTAMALLSPGGEFLRVNAALQRMLGAERSSLRDLDEAILEGFERAPEAIAAAFREGELDHYDAEQEIRFGAGGSLWVHITAAPVRSPDGEVEHVVVHIQDINERKREELRLRSSLAHLSVVERIRRALDEDRFVLHAQPIIDLAGGEQVSEELLIRMIDEEGAVVPPAEFLPGAERTGLICEIDLWVVRQGIARAAAGHAVEINLSGRSLGDPRLAPAVEAALAVHRPDPSLVVFEVTETAMVEHLDAATAFARRVAELGCRVALDDFGTGYGTFTTAKALPISYVKIDIEFVRDLVTNIRSEHIVRSVVAFAASVGARTIAEGVEDAETLGRLRELGVDLAQGFFIGRPAATER